MINRRHTKNNCKIEFSPEVQQAEKYTAAWYYGFVSQPKPNRCRVCVDNRSHTFPYEVDYFEVDCRDCFGYILHNE